MTIPSKSRRSGGPKIDQGKLISSRNSLKTGTYSKLVVLPDENHEEFDSLLAQFNADFYPKDAVEIILIREIAVITWKKLRLEKLEQNYLVKQLSDPVTLEEFLSCGNGYTKETHQAWVERGVLDEEKQQRYIKILEFITPYKRQHVSEEGLAQIKAAFPKFYKLMIDFYKAFSPPKEGEPTCEEVAQFQVRFGEEELKFIVPAYFDVVIPSMKSSLWCTTHQEAIRQNVATIKQERLLNLMQLGRVQRAGDDLGRAFVRTLGEFRKHHEWRLKNTLGDASQLES